MATNYTYTAATHNGCALRIIRTEAWNIILAGLSRSSSLSGAGLYGINGGFFDYAGPNGNTKAMALNNNIPIYYMSTVNDKLGGWDTTMGRAAFCYDSSSGLLVFRTNAAPTTSSLYKPIANGGSLDNVVAPSDRYWAQGGPDFRLGEPDGSWETGFESEIGSLNLTGSATRACICANLSAKVVYLIITTSSVTIGKFRKAVHEYLSVPTTGYHTNVVGIFLDGGTSTTLRCKDNNGSPTDYGTARLEQVIALRNTN